MSRFVTVYVCIMYVCMIQILGDVVGRCTSSFGAVRLVLISPLNCWCNTSLGMIKIGFFSTNHGQSLFDHSRSCFWYTKVSEISCLSWGVCNQGLVPAIYPMTEVSGYGHCMTRDSPGIACHRINGTFNLVEELELVRWNLCKHGRLKKVST